MVVPNEEDWNCDAMVFESLLSSLPMKQTAATVVKSVHPLSDGSTLTSSLSLSLPRFGLPFGLDRELLEWLVERALRTREANVSWEVLLEYLGPDLTSMEKERLYFAARRLSGASTMWERKGGSLSGFNFVSTQVSTCDEPSSAAGATGEFMEETKFVFDLNFLVFVERTQLQLHDASPASGLSDYSYVPFCQIPIINPEMLQIMRRDTTKT